MRPPAQSFIGNLSKYPKKCRTNAFSIWLKSPVGLNVERGKSMLREGIELALQQRRSMEQALVELRESYARAPNQRLARMISQLEAEITERARRQGARSQRQTPRPT